VLNGLFPIPPGYYCVPSAIAALTGADPESVIVPAINRHARARSLLGAPAGVRMSVARAVLTELGCGVRPYRDGAPAGPLRAQVRTWAARSLRWSGRPVLIATAGHALVVLDGRVHDNHAPLGAEPDAHPFGRSVVRDAMLVEGSRRAS